MMWLDGTETVASRMTSKTESETKIYFICPEESSNLICRQPPVGYITYLPITY